MSDLNPTEAQGTTESAPLPENVIPEKKSVEPKAIPSKVGDAKPVPAAHAKAGGAAGAPPKKPAKKVVKSWPSVNALITALSLTATLGGWAHFTVAEMRRAEAEAAAFAASQAVVAPAAPIAEVAPPVVLTTTLDIALPPIPTVVPAQTFNINSGGGSAPVDTAAVVAPAPVAPAVAPAAPVLRSVAPPPPPVVSAPAPAPAPAPAASTSSSR